MSHPMSSSFQHALLGAAELTNKILLGSALLQLGFKYCSFTWPEPNKHLEMDDVNSPTCHD
eukprot:5168117-Amphidinium_carterae.1